MIQAVPYIGEPATLPLINIRSVKQIRMRNGFDEEGLRELAASIKEVGIIEPLIVRPDPTNATATRAQYILIAGERRIMAASLAGLAEVPVIVRDIDENEAKVIQAIENLQRENLAVADIADGVLEMAHSGKTPKDIAKALGKSTPWVSKHLSLARAHADVRAVMNAGLTSDAELLMTLAQVRKFPGGEGVKVFDRLSQGLVAGTTTRASARAALEALKAGTPEGAADAGADDEGDDEGEQAEIEGGTEFTITLPADLAAKLIQLGGTKWLANKARTLIKHAKA